MAYAYWASGRHNVRSTFDLFYRKCPFGGEYTIFAGLEEVLKYLESFRFSAEHLARLREMIPHADEGFFEYLGSLDCSEVQLFAVPEGSIIFPRVPCITVVGPLGVCQLLETTLLTLCNFPRWG